MSEITKMCVNCKVKPVRSEGMRFKYCVDCMIIVRRRQGRENYHANRDKNLKRNRAYRAANRAKVNAMSVAYYHNNKEKRKKWARDYYYRNRELIKAKGHAYYLKKKAMKEG